MQWGRWLIQQARYKPLGLAGSPFRFPRLVLFAIGTRLASRRLASGPHATTVAKWRRGGVDNGFKTSSVSLPSGTQAAAIFSCELSARVCRPCRAKSLSKFLISKNLNMGEKHASGPLQQNKISRWKFEFGTRSRHGTLNFLIEMELVRMQQRATVGSKSTRKESAARSIGHAGPDMKGWENEFQVKITLDARTITKRTSQTEVMMQVFKRACSTLNYLNANVLILVLSQVFLDTAILNHLSISRRMPYGSLR